MTPTNSSFLTNESMALEDYYQAAKNEEEISRLKSGAIWLKCGDKNTKFFYTMQKIKSNSNIIHSLKDREGKLVHDQEEIVKEFETYFERMFNGPHVMQDEQLIFPKRVLKKSAADWLKRSFDEDEIFSSLKQCGKDKAPSLNGYTTMVFLENWELVKYTVVKAVKNFFKQGILLKEINLYSHMPYSQRLKW